MTNNQEYIKPQKPPTSAMEDYLETIYTLNQEKKVVRVKDIAKNLHVKMPTVTSMLKSLNKRGLVEYERYEYIQLTERGAQIGREIKRRHHILQKFLINILKLDDQTADQDACKMEHDLSLTTLNRLVDFMDFIQTCPRTGEDWLERFKEFRLYGHRPENCSERCKEFSSEIKKEVDRLEGISKDSEE